MASPSKERSRRAAQDAAALEAAIKAASVQLARALHQLGRGEPGNYAVLAWRMDEPFPGATRHALGGQQFAAREDDYKVASSTYRAEKAAEAEFFGLPAPALWAASVGPKPCPPEAQQWAAEWQAVNDHIAARAALSLAQARERLGA